MAVPLAILAILSGCLSAVVLWSHGPLFALLGAPLIASLATAMASHGLGRPEALPLRRSLGHSDLERFMAAKGIDTGCPACGSLDFTLPGEEEGGAGIGLPTLRRIPGVVVGTGACRALIISCAHCGTLRFMARKPVLEWVTAGGTDGDFGDGA